MSAAVCTLFEGSYHLGLAALSNSLFASGFRGTIHCGYRGALPPWVEQGPRRRQLENGELRYALAEGLELHFIPLAADLHFTNYKPTFMLRLLEGAAKTCDTLLYLDPDIVVKAPWAQLEIWARDGVGLCEDVNANMPARHPLRLQWMDWLETWKPAIQPRALERYYSGGFVGIQSQHTDFLRHWESIIGEMGRYLGSLGQLKSGRAGSLFHSLDQDALNIALMTHVVPINASGPEGMDFAPGGSLLSHAIGSRKPWSSSFIKDALRGFPPTMAQKCYFEHVSQPIAVFSPGQRRGLLRRLQLAALIGRFYGRR